MVEIGKYNILTVNRFVDFGAYLDGGDLGEILIPSKYIPEGTEVDDTLNVFVYLDSEERYIATTENVVAEVGQIASLEVVSVNDFGAFADWGLIKHLFIPYREQTRPLHEGDKAIVYIYIDEKTYRLAGSMRIEKYIDPNIEGLEEKDKVDVLIYRETPSGFIAIIQNQCLGMIYHNQVFQDLSIGDETTAYIKKIREDGKIDLILQEEGYGHVVDFSDTLYADIEKKGKIKLHDKSSPEDIYDEYGVSKKIFKKAVGNLLKARKITIEKDGIALS